MLCTLLLLVGCLTTNRPAIRGCHSSAARNLLNEDNNTSNESISKAVLALASFSPTRYIYFLISRRQPAVDPSNYYLLWDQVTNQKDIHCLFHPGNISICHLSLPCAGYAEKFSSIGFVLFLSVFPS